MGAEQAELRLINGFSVRVGGQEIEFPKSAQRLLAFVALNEGGVSREFVATTLWPDQPEKRGRANLRSSIWRVRRKSDDLLLVTPTHLRLRLDVWVDVVHGLLPAEVLEATSHRGPLIDSGMLPGWYDDWVGTERERVQQRRLAALEQTGQRWLREGRPAHAIQCGLEAVSIEPLRESAHRLIIDSHLAEGNVAEARRQFDRCSEILTRDLGITPSPMTGHALPAPCR